MLFELRDVGLARGGRQVLDSVSAEIPAGATAIVGPSGAGKSTLLRLLNRLADPDTGTVAYRGPPARRVRPAGAAPRGLAGAAAAGAAGGDGGVEPRLRGGAGRHASSTRDRCLALAGLDPAFAERDVSKLSVGEQQRAMLARALAQRAARCCCSTSRPRRSTTRPATRSRRPSPSCARELEISLVLVSHDPEQARRLGDWVVRIEAGRAVAARPARGGAGVSASIHVALGQVAAALVLVAVAVGDLALAPGRPRARHRRRRPCAPSSS